MTLNIVPLSHEAPPIPDAGLGALATERGNLPLDTVDVHAGITGLVAGVEVSQGFRNPFDVPLEATYVFPLPDRAAVTRMRMEAADRVVEGTLKERGQARADYDAAIAAGRRAAIAEEDRPDVFTMRVGNILPGERVTVRLSLVQPLPYEDDAATFRFPLVVAPRYIPGSPLPDQPTGDGIATDTDAVPDASRVSPPVLLPGFPNPVQLSLTVDIDPGGLPLGEIRSSLHVVSQGDSTVRLQPGERLDRDFILRLAHPRQETAASLTLAPDEDGGTFTVTVLPPAMSGQARPRDVVLLLDRSGSMAGWKMVAARRAAARIIDTLTDQDRFEVLAFDHEITRPPRLPHGLSQATDRNRFRAVEHLAGLEARGGTELLAPLQQAATRLIGEVAGRDRVLVLITDGQVGNEDHILARIQSSLTGLRVHTVGIDRAVNAGFLGRLAMVGQGGRFELVESEDRLDEAMEHIHHRISAPVLTGLTLDWSGVRIDPGTLAPHRLNALFPGVPLVITGRYRQASDDGSVTIKAITAEGTPWQRQATAKVGKSDATAPVWARAHLRDLEDQYATAGLPDLERRIVSLSLRYNVLCRFTAFVAVDTRVAADGRPTHQVIQPVEQPSGWQLPTVTATAATMSAPLARPAPGSATSPADHGGAPAAPAGPPPAPSAPPAYPRPARWSPPPAAPDAELELEYGLDVPDSRVGARALPYAAGDHPARSTPDLPNVLALLKQELQHLESLTNAPRPERWRHLSDLRTRLLGLTEPAQSEGLPTARLTTLASALKITDDLTQQSRLEELWALTVEELTALIQSHPQASQPHNPANQPQSRRSFWKRRP